MKIDWPKEMITDDKAHIGLNKLAIIIVKDNAKVNFRRIVSFNRDLIYVNVQNRNDETDDYETLLKSEDVAYLKNRIRLEKVRGLMNGRLG